MMAGKRITEGFNGIFLLIPTQETSTLYHRHKVVIRLLVNTGAEISLLSPRHQDKVSPGTQILQAVNGAPIPSYAERSLTLSSQLGRKTMPFPWIFVIVEVEFHIPGADYLEHFSLLVDIKRRKISRAGESMR